MDITRPEGRANTMKTPAEEAVLRSTAPRKTPTSTYHIRVHGFVTNAKKNINVFFLFCVI